MNGKQRTNWEYNGLVCNQNCHLHEQLDLQDLEASLKFLNPATFCPSFRPSLPPEREELQKTLVSMLQNFFIHHLSSLETNTSAWPLQAFQPSLIFAMQVNSLHWEWSTTRAVYGKHKTGQKCLPGSHKLMYLELRWRRAKVFMTLSTALTTMHTIFMREHNRDQ